VNTAKRQDAEQRRLWLDESQLRYHVDQFERPYRSTVHFGRFLASLPLHGGEALDIACGAGSNIYYLSHVIPGFHWTGVDIAGDMLFPIAREKFADANLDVTLVSGDLYELDRLLARQRFDLVISTQTLSWLPDHERALCQALCVTRGWLAMSSLFSEADVDTECLVYDHTIVPELPPYHMNVYSLNRMRAFCEGHGGREFRSEPFDIDIDLPRPASGGLGSYTERLADGRRLQFTGPVHLPWRFVAARMGD
jgi:SAM-dependent methyltransferase